MLISSMRSEPASLEEWHDTRCISRTFCKGWILNGCKKQCYDYHNMWISICPVTYLLKPLKVAILDRQTHLQTRNYAEWLEMLLTPVIAGSAIQTADKISVISLLSMILSIVYIDSLECKTLSLKSFTFHRQLQCIDAARNCANLGMLLYVCRIVWIGYRSCEGVYITKGETSCGTYRELNRGPRTKQYW